ncbi:hypothetical protein FOZ60_008215 [Perkinsus olseni]|uniref:Carboxypeptidase Y n=1 Tax=Perkinsus olseni TaxID=32597 RepID=A0A7J6NKY2_PEROL|nr:hypothetical protein FOZ60_008215 [Perkinsus olseni]
MLFPSIILYFSSFLSELATARLSSTGAGNTTSRRLQVIHQGKGGLCDPNVEQAHGSYTVDPQNPKREYFFWFFESRNDPETDPIFLWLEGGPGESGVASAVGYNGPCLVNKKGTEASTNPYSWTNRANGIWLDQPVRVGYSKGWPPEQTFAETVENIYSFLDQFLDEFPKYKGPFYLVGASYAGVLLPQVAHAVKIGSPKINLRGIIFCNAMVNARKQWPSFPEMAFKSKTVEPVITEDQYDKMNQQIPACLDMIDKCNKQIKSCEDAHIHCQSIVLDPLVENGVDFYKLSAKCSDPDQHLPEGCLNEEDPPNVEAYLNRENVKTFLKVSGKFIISSDSVYQQLSPFALVNSDYFLPGLLDSDIRVLTIAGDVDSVCNFMGLKEWMLGLTWRGQEDFRKAADVEFKDSTGRVVGLRRTSNNGGYDFVQVYRAGHAAAHQNPRGVMETVNSFMLHTRL